jgi:hypothetical protein
MASDEHPTWEYRVAPHLDETALNELGLDGWELVAVAGETFYLKRSRLGFRERVTLDQKRRYYALWGRREESRQGAEG